MKKRCAECGCEKFYHPKDEECLQCGYCTVYSYDPNKKWDECSKCKHLVIWHHKEFNGCMQDMHPEPKEIRKVIGASGREEEVCACSETFGNE